MNTVPCWTSSYRNTVILRQPKHSLLACWVNTMFQRRFTPISSGVMVRQLGNYPCSTLWSTSKWYRVLAATI